MLVMGSDKDDGRQFLRGQNTQHLESIHAWHLHVEEYEVGRKLENLFNRGRAVSAFADDLDIGSSLEAQRHALPRQWLIIDDQDAHTLSARSGAFRYGSSILTSQPPASGHCNSNLCSPA